MLLDSEESMNDLILLEVETVARDVQVGVVHNDYAGAVLITHLKLKDLIAAYQLNFAGNTVQLAIKNIYRGSNLFSKNLTIERSPNNA